MLSRNSHWLIHKNGFSLVQLTDNKENNLSTHVNYVRSQVNNNNNNNNDDDDVYFLGCPRPCG